LNKATHKDTEYKKDPIIGTALESFSLLKKIICAEPMLAYTRADITNALIVDTSTGTDKRE
jgi:hypothetical protein